MTPWSCSRRHRHLISPAKQVPETPDAVLFPWAWCLSWLWKPLCTQGTLVTSGSWRSRGLALLQGNAGDGTLALAVVVGCRLLLICCVSR